MEKVLNTCSDERIVQLIITLEQVDGNIAVRCIYKIYGAGIRRFLNQKILTSKVELIEDILTDTILAFFNAIRQKRFELRDHKSVKAYLKRTAQNLLNQEFRAIYKGSQQKEKELDDVEKFVLNKMTDEERKGFLQQLAEDTHLQEEVELKRQMIYRKRRIEELDENIEAETKLEIENVNEMKSLMQQLSPLQQHLLMAHYHQDIGFSTYAEIKNMTPESVRQQHHRSLKKLKDLFEKLKN